MLPQSNHLPVIALVKDCRPEIAVFFQKPTTFQSWAIFVVYAEQVT